VSCLYHFRETLLRTDIAAIDFSKRERKRETETFGYVRLTRTREFTGDSRSSSRMKHVQSVEMNLLLFRKIPSLSVKMSSHDPYR